MAALGYTNLTPLMMGLQLCMKGTLGGLTWWYSVLDWWSWATILPNIKHWLLLACPSLHDWSAEIAVVTNILLFPCNSPSDSQLLTDSPFLSFLTWEVQETNLKQCNYSSLYTNCWNHFLNNTFFYFASLFYWHPTKCYSPAKISTSSHLNAKWEENCFPIGKNYLYFIFHINYNTITNIYTITY